MLCPHAGLAPVEAGATHSRVDLDVEFERTVVQGQRGPTLEGRKIGNRNDQTVTRSHLKRIHCKRAEHDDRARNAEFTELCTFARSGYAVSPGSERIELPHRPLRTETIPIGLDHWNDRGACPDAGADRLEIGTQCRRVKLDPRTDLRLV